jgi:uncharacterized protein (TIGR03083 family)
MAPAPGLSTAEYLEAIERESAALADAAARAGLDAAVPSCPDWRVADLVAHIGNVQRWAALTVATLPAERIDRTAMTESPSRAGLLEWFRTASGELVDALAAADPSARVWAFGPDRTVGFWFRRQAHEVALHRWDAARAGGAPLPIDRALATDGVAEWLELSTTARAKHLTGVGETVHLHCTDAAADGVGEWLVTLTADGPTVDTIHAKGDVAARGTASALDLFVWGRREPDSLEVFGDVALLERVRRAGFG